MKRARSSFAAGVALPLLGVVLLGLGIVACGSRTGLLTELDETGGGDDDSSEGGIVTRTRDAGSDATLPTVEAGKPPVVVVKSDCEDASQSVLYVVTEEREVVAFDPPSATFRSLGTLNCGEPDGYQPFSMAVDRSGHAYILYNGPDAGLVFRASLATLECESTPYVNQTSDFFTFGMGFSTDLGGPSEQLYIAGDGTPSALGTLATDTYVTHEIGDIDSQVTEGELTGTGDGRLYTFYATDDSTTAPANIGELDKTTGKLLSSTTLNDVSLGNGWAFGFFGGEFYLFTGTDDGFGGGQSSVTLYNPADGTTRVIASYPGLIVGAGVSTCAPEQ